MLNEIQRKILDLLETRELTNITLRKLGKLLGLTHPQSVRYHLGRLESLGLIKIDKTKKTISKLCHDTSVGNLVSLPILGSANCGVTTIFAEENIEGFLKISRGLVNSANVNNLFVIRAIGDSMDRAIINGQNIEEGDYVIVNKNVGSINNGDYVLSIIDDMANIKKFFRNNEENIILISESSKDYPPIYITQEDYNYFVNGKIVRVIKK